MVPGDLEMFQTMYAGGCREVSFGIESGDQNVLDFLQKGIKVEDSIEAIINAKNAGMIVRILFMIGTPGETKETVDKNIQFLNKVDNYYDTMALTTFVPIPGSQIANTPEKFNCRIIDNNIDNYNFYLWNPEGINDWKSLIELDGMSQKEIHDNKERMKEYILSVGKSNKG